MDRLQRQQEELSRGPRETYPQRREAFCSQKTEYTEAHGCLRLRIGQLVGERQQLARNYESQLTGETYRQLLDPNVPQLLRPNAPKQPGFNPRAGEGKTDS